MNRSRKKGASVLAILTLILTLGLLRLVGVATADLLPTDPVGELPDIPDDPVEFVTGTVQSAISPSPSPSSSPSPSPSPSPDQGGAPGETDDAPEPQPPAQPSDVSSQSSTSTTALTTKSSKVETLITQEMSPAAADSQYDASPRILAHEFIEPRYYSSGGSRSTIQVVKVLRGTNATPQQIARVLAPFPVVGEAWYSDDWAAPRHFPEFHLHEGTDIFAERGTPVVASSDGTITSIVQGSKIAGNMLAVVGVGGTRFVYSHLDRFAPGIVLGMNVNLGQVIGFVGDTGNAEGTIPHLHFEIHPNGGASVPPVPYLDRWLAEALQKAKALEQVPQIGFGSVLAHFNELNKKVAAKAQKVAASTTDVAQVQGVTAAHAAPWAALLAVPPIWYIRRRVGRQSPEMSDLFKSRR